MWKKIILFSVSLLFFALANANLCCSVSIDGQDQPGLFSLGSVIEGRQLAYLTADEILKDEAHYPTLQSRYSLSFKKPSGTISSLADSMLASTDGIAVTQGVYVGGERLGCVANAFKLRSALNSFIQNQLPTWAVAGTISGDLKILSQYSREGQTTNTDDMVLLITGMAPVLYLDGKGYMSNA